MPARRSIAEGAALSTEFATRMFVRLCNDVYGTDKRRYAINTARRTAKDFDTLNFAQIYRQIKGIMPRLRIADIDTIEQDDDVLTCTTSDADIGLCSHGESLSDIYARNVFEQVVDTLRWRSGNGRTIQHLNNSRRLATSQRCT